MSRLPRKIPQIVERTAMKRYRFEWHGSLYQFRYRSQHEPNGYRVAAPTLSGAQMTRQLIDRVAIVTGASHGLGRGIARALAAAGAKTVMAARRTAVVAVAAAGLRGAGG